MSGVLSMRIIGQTFALLLGLAILAVLGVGGYRAVTFIVGLFAGVESQIGRIVAIASAVFLLASIIIARAIWHVGGRMNANQLLEGKVATYRQLVDLWNGLVRNERETGDRSRAQSLEELGNLEASLAVYGGARVLKAHLALRASERGRGRQSPEVRSQLAKLLWEIRKDLGSATVGLTAEDLQQLLFADAEPVSTSADTSTCQGRRLPVSLRSDS